MSRFGYWRDLLFLLASGAYALNRWVLKPLIPSPFLHNHFNDLLLIPAALPVMLWIQRILGLRKHDQVPTWPEVLMHWAIWSIVCEWIGPFYCHMGVADIWDVASYGVGGIVAGLWWNHAAMFSFNKFELEDKKQFDKPKCQWNALTPTLSPEEREKKTRRAIQGFDARAFTVGDSRE